MLLLAAQVLALFSPSPVAPGDCAQTLEPAAKAALLARERSGQVLALPDDGRILSVALAFHVVRTSAGMGGIAPEQLQAALGDARGAFAPGGIAFELVYADTIDDDELYTIEGPFDLAELRRTSVVPGAINVYFVESLFFGIYCGLSAYSTDPIQGIVMANACTGTAENPSTFPHEIAHYFDVFHTWDAIGGLECTSGEGCRITGDLVCDTAAAPALSISDITPYPDCAYVGTDAPPCAGDPRYDPDLTNYMAAGYPQCRSHFTRGQLRRARAGLVLHRAELVLL